MSEFENTSGSSGRELPMSVFPPFKPIGGHRMLEVWDQEGASMASVTISDCSSEKLGAYQRALLAAGFELTEPERFCKRTGEMYYCADMRHALQEDGSAYFFLAWGEDADAIFNCFPESFRALRRSRRKRNKARRVDARRRRRERRRVKVELRRRDREE